MEILDQPAPVKNDNVPVWNLVINDLTTNPLLVSDTAPDIFDLVVSDMKERDKVGRERYGTPLQTFNGRDCVVDAAQECLDLIVYLRQGIEEGKQGLAYMYSNALRLYFGLRRNIANR